MDKYGNKLSRACMKTCRIAGRFDLLSYMSETGDLPAARLTKPKYKTGNGSILNRETLYKNYHLQNNNHGWGGQ
jgi:hypothetical protein